MHSKVLTSDYPEIDEESRSDQIHINKELTSAHIEDQSSLMTKQWFWRCIHNWVNKVPCVEEEPQFIILNSRHYSILCATYVLYF